MKKAVGDHVIGIPITDIRYPVEKLQEMPDSAPCGPFSFPSPTNSSSQFKQNKVDSIIRWMNKFSKKADSFASGVREHVKTGSKFSETVMGKLSLGAMILQRGGIQKVFEQTFKVAEREKLLHACQCSLSTSAGPIAGLLFISTEKIAFLSDRYLTLRAPDSRLVLTPYKVLIPLEKVQSAYSSENVNKPTQKYIQIVTADNFEFWFMAFINYQKAFKHLQHVVAGSSTGFPQ